MLLADYLPCCWTTPADFPRFKQLPAELRLMVWREALPDPRTIQIVKRQIVRVRNVALALSPLSPDNDHSFPSGTGAVIWYDNSLPQKNCISLQESYCTSTINCPSDLMALLGACRESRLETLCRYKPIFIPRMPKSSFFPLHYFDPLVDSIFIEDIWPWARGQYSKPAALFETRRLSISCNGWSQRWNSSRSQRAKFLGKNGLLRFKHLEELNIVWRVLNHEEERKILQYNFGRYMGPGDMTVYLRRSGVPHDIAFPGTHVNICAKDIREKFVALKKANPDWSIPKIRFIKWATAPSSPPTSPYL